MTPNLLPAIETYIRANRGVDPTHAKGAALACLEALAQGWLLPDGLPLRLEGIALSGIKRSADAAERASRALLMAVGVQVSAPRWARPQTAQDEARSTQLWFHAEKCLAPDTGEGFMPPPAQLVANCRCLFQSAGMLRINTDAIPFLTTVHAGGDEEIQQLALITVTVAGLLALSDGRHIICVADANAAMALLIGNLTSLYDSFRTIDCAVH